MPRQITSATSLDQSAEKKRSAGSRQLRADDSEARARFERAYPTAPADPVLRDVQHALAREYGHEIWVALKKALEQPCRSRAAPPATSRH